MSRKGLIKRKKEEKKQTNRRIRKRRKYYFKKKSVLIPQASLSSPSITRDFRHNKLVIPSGQNYKVLEQ